MTPRSSLSPRLLFCVLLGLIGASVGHAQLEVKSTSFTLLFQGAKPVDPDGLPAPTGTQYGSEYSNSGGSFATSHLTTPGNEATRVLDYPASAAFKLVRSTSGNSFAQGVPRFLLGDTITPPTTDINGVALTVSNYWRAEPVAAGEAFVQPISGTIYRPIVLTLNSVKVKTGGNGYTSAPSVVFTANGPGSGAAATANVVGGVVSSITLTSAGTGYTALPTVQLIGGGGIGATAEAAAPPTPYYWSPHADRVFASFPAQWDPKLGIHVT